MIFSESEYIQAHNYAAGQAKSLNQCYGIEKMRQFGKTVFSVKMIPNNPERRFGWELGCEVVTPESPIFEIEKDVNNGQK